MPLAPSSAAGGRDGRGSALVGTNRGEGSTTWGGAAAVERKREKVCRL